jgi:hypothetical protein
MDLIGILVCKNEYDGNRIYSIHRVGYSSVGLLALQRNIKSVTNRLFFAFSVMMVLWMVCNYVSNTSSDYNVALWANRLIFTVTSFLVWFLYLFAIAYPATVYLQINKKLHLVGWIFSLGIALLGISPLIVESVTLYEGYSDIRLG